VRSPEITIGVIGVIVSAAFSWVPSLWYDEGATVASAQRTWAQLWAEVHHVDAVHALYYALMHAWFAVVGYTPFTLRFPSALAIGVAAALVVALGRRLGGKRVGIVAGIVFVLLPRVTWAGSEGRPYATITALSACLTLIGITTIRRRGRPRAGRWWVAYAAFAALAVTFNIYLSLLVIAHGVALLWTFVAERRRARTVAWEDRAPRRALVTRRTLVLWLIAGACAALAVTPLVAEIMHQARQVSWIGPITAKTPAKVFHTSWFGGSNLYASIAWGLMALATVSGLVLARRPRASGRSVVRGQAVRVLLPVTIVPIGLLLAATAAGEHLYSPKYATLSLPYVAVLMALGITMLRPRVVLTLAVAIMIVVSVPTTVAVKRPHAKQDSYWAQAAEVVAAQRALHPSVEEGVIYGSVYKHPSTTAQIIADAYPSAFTGMRDLLTVTSGAATGRLWNTNGSVATTVPTRLHGIDTVYLVEAPTRSIEPAVSETLDEHGFALTDTWTTGKVIIAEYTAKS
jgi:mannosyltransferase